MTLPSDPADAPPPGAIEVVARAAQAIARGDLVELNADLHPRAAAELVRIAGEDDAEAGPVITSVSVQPAGDGSDREQVFDIRFAAADRVMVLRVVALRVAGTWRVGRVLGVTHEGGES